MNIFFACFRSPISNVFFYTCRKKNRFLEYNTELGPVFSQLMFFYIMIIYCYIALGGFIKPGQKVFQSVFPLPGEPHDPNILSVPTLKRNIMINRVSLDIFN